MKFTVSSSLLQKLLSSINGVISSNPVVPILENYLFNLDKDKLIVSASDLQISMITQMDVVSTDTGSIAVPSKMLLDTLKVLPEQPITIEMDMDSFTINIKSENGQYTLAGENAEDFPKIPVASKGKHASFHAKALSDAIANTLFAASNDELRPSMNGVFLKMTETNTTFVSTDGNRLVRYRRVDVASKEEISMIIPKKALTLLKAALPNDETDVKAEFSKSNIFFNFGHTQMICRLIDERFPDYENAIPAENPNKMIISRSELLGSLKRIGLYANKTTNLVRFKITSTGLIASAEDIDYSSAASETLSCQYEGEDIEIGFNAKYLAEMLGNMSCKEISVEMSAPNRAGLIFPVEKDENVDTLMLLMPVMLSSYVS